MLKLLQNSIVLLIVALLLAGCSFFEDEEVAKPAQLDKLVAKTSIKTLWVNRNKEGTRDQYLKLTPAFVGNRAFTVSYQGTIKAVDLKTGNDIWSVNSNWPLTSGVAADSQFIYVGSGAGRVFALRQSNGGFVWQATVPSEILATPVAASGRLIVKTADGKVYAFNAATGAQLWNYIQPTPDLILRGSSMPKVVGNLVIDGLANGQVVALNLNTGAVEWKQTIAEPSGRNTMERMTDIDADPVVVNNIIYIATYQGQVAALTLQGKILWQKELSSYAGLTVGPKYIYAVSADGHIWAIDKKTGAKVWEQTALTNRDLSTPTIYRQTLVVGDYEGYVHWLSLDDGKLMAREHPDSSSILVQPLVYGDYLYVMTKAGRLVKYRD